MLFRPYKKEENLYGIGSGQHLNRKLIMKKMASLLACLVLAGMITHAQHKNPKAPPPPTPPNVEVVEVAPPPPPGSIEEPPLLSPPPAPPKVKHPKRTSPKGERGEEVNAEPAPPPPFTTRRSA